jgi:hypothetical protein
MTTVHSPTGHASSFQLDISDVDSEESDTDYESDSESEAQYITILPDSMWYKSPPSSADESSPHHNDHRATTPSTLASDKLERSSINPRLSGLRDQFRRLVYLEDESEFDADCWGSLDTPLLFAPARAFEDTCWSSTSSSPCKPLPDVPVDLDEVYEDLEPWSQVSIFFGKRWHSF